jgi:hypothetical protein
MLKLARRIRKVLPTMPVDFPGDDGRARLRDALKITASTLKRAEIGFALGGSYALWARGAPESEHDVDFVIAEDDVPRAVETMSGAGMEVLHPPEDWLVKVRVEGVVVDLLHRMAGVPVTAEVLARAGDLEVLSIRMPVLDATDLVETKLKTLTEHYCDFAALLPAVRAVREQLDWDRLARETADNDFAAAFLFLCERLGLTG